MPRLEKWLTDVRRDEGVARAARKALKARLPAVEHFLREASHVSGKAEDDAESVHQLRVWSRRASAALRLFDEVLPRRVAKWLKRKLRKIRRTAGQARDCDVLAARLEDDQEPGLEHAVVHLRSGRRKAEKKLSGLHRQLIKSGKFSRKTDRLLLKLKTRDKRGNDKRRRGKIPSFGPWCRQRLAPLRDEFLKRAGADLTRDEGLHQLRIAGKRLRYALELAPAALPDVVHQRLYDELSDLQDRLGEVCDRLATVARLKEWQSEAGDQSTGKHLRAMLAAEQKEFAAGKQRFLRWWTAKRRKSLAKRWEQALRPT